MKKFILILLCWFLCNSTFAQTCTNFIKPTTDVVDIAIDAKGQKWILTSKNGIYISDDGENYKILGAKEGFKPNLPYKIYIDKENVKWILTNEGVYSYNDKIFINYQKSDGLIDNEIMNFAVDKKGNKWFATRSKGISKFDGQNWTNFSPEDGTIKNKFIQSLFADPKGNIWIFHGKNFSIFDGKKWTELADTNKIYNYLGSDNKDRMWFSRANDCISFDGKNWKIALVKSELETSLKKIKVDPKGNIWGYDYSNWFIYDENQWILKTKSPSTDNFDFDIKGNLWAIGPSGIDIFDGQNWRETDCICGEDLSCVFVDSKNRKWFGSKSNGASMYDGKIWTNYRQGSQIGNNFVNSFTEDAKGNIWIGTDNGFSLFDGKDWKIYTQGLIYQVAQAIAIDNQANKWIATSRGISKFDGTNFTNYGKDKGVSPYRVRDIAVDKNGGVWAAISNMRGAGGTVIEGGLAKFDGSVWKILTTKDGFLGNHAESIAIENNSIWVATNAGVCKYDGANWTSYTAKDGFTNNANYVFIDKKGMKWFGTNQGLYSFDGKNWKNYTKKDGLVNNEVLGIAEDADGSLWLATSGGATKLTF